MHFIGKIAVYLGGILIAVGMVVGFTIMLTSNENETIQWIGLVPWGFLILLTGMVMTQLSRPKNK